MLLLRFLLATAAAFIGALVTLILVAHHAHRLSAESAKMPRSVGDGFTFVPDPGYYIDNKTKDRLCGPCLQKGTISRLSVHHSDGLKCRTCGEIYISPGSYNAAFSEYADRGPLEPPHFPDS